MHACVSMCAYVVCIQMTEIQENQISGPPGSQNANMLSSELYLHSQPKLLTIKKSSTISGHLLWQIKLLNICSPHIAVVKMGTTNVLEVDFAEAFISESCSAGIVMWRAGLQRMAAVSRAAGPASQAFCWQRRGQAEEENAEGGGREDFGRQGPHHEHTDVHLHISMEIKRLTIRLASYLSVILAMRLTTLHSYRSGYLASQLFLVYELTIG